jgi:ABC-type transport system involved in cytochrome c biogenesis permease component
MNSMTMFWRIVWKDVRIQRQAWLAILIATPFVHLAYQAFMALESAPTEPLGHLAVALVASVVYMLGCGATLFSSEDESGTLDLLRSFPISSGRVFLAKISLGVVSGLALAITLSLIAGLAFGGGDVGDAWPRIVAAAGVGGVELFAWSILCGFLTRHPLWAAALGVTIPSFLLGTLYPALWPQVPSTLGVFQNHVSFLEARSVIVVGLLAVNALLARAWFTGRLDEWRMGWSWRRSAPSDSWIRPATQIGRWAPWRRHFWLTIRQGRWFMLGLIALHGICFGWWFPEVNSGRSAYDPGLLYLPLIVTALAAGVLGFGLDQFQGRFRFYAEQGVDVRQVWWSRQLVWGGVLLLSLLMTLVPAVFNRGDYLWFDQWGHQTTIVIYASVILFAVGQLSAFFLRRLIVAAVAPFLSLLPVMTWAAFIHVGGVSPWIGIAPIPPALLLVTWYFARPWYDERLDRRAKIQLGVMLLGPLLAVGLLTCAYRALELRDMDPGFSQAALIHGGSRDEGKVRNQFLQIARAPAGDWNVPARRAELIKQLDSLLATQSGPVCDWQREIDEIRWSSLETQIVGDARRVINGLVNAARQDIQDKRLDDAWAHLVRALRIVRWLEDYASVETYQSALRAETYVFREIQQWAKAPGQTAAQLRDAAASLASLEERLSGGLDSIKLGILATERMIEGKIQPLASERDEVAPAVISWFPSERIRSRRLLHQFSWHALADQQRRLESVRLNRGVTTFGYGLPLSNVEFQRALQNSYLPASAYITTHVGWTYMEQVVRYRGSRAALLIGAEAIDEGQLPTSLEGWPNNRERSLPKDPVTGGSFVYLPTAQRGPAVWSPGLAQGVTVKLLADGSYEFTRWNRPIAEESVLKLGVFFEIP